MGWFARDTPVVAHLPLEISCAGRDAAKPTSLMNVATGMLTRVIKGLS